MVYGKRWPIPALKSLDGVYSTAWTTIRPPVYSRRLADQGRRSLFALNALYTRPGAADKDFFAAARTFPDGCAGKVLHRNDSTIGQSLLTSD
jgi:hypothetical protein